MFLLNGGLLAAVTVLSVKTGLILGTSWLSTRALVLVASGFGGGLYLLTMVFAGRQQLLVQVLDRYTFWGAVLVALALIYLGLQEPDFSGRGKAGNRNSLTYLLGFLPCPFCMAALAFSVIVMAPLLGVTVPVLGRGIAVVFTALVAASGLGTRKLIGLTGYRPVSIFNQLLFFTGMLTLTFALIIPNFVRAMTMRMHPIEISSPGMLGVSVMVMVGFIFAGYFQYQMKLNRKG